MKIKILGCGSSVGVPCLHYGWGNCDPRNPKNFRTRASIIIEKENTSLLVDMSPDLRQQLLRYENPKIDAVIFTHEHYDHTNGINELRPMFLGTDRSLPIYANKEIIDNIHKMFFYLFRDTDNPIYRPYMNVNIISDTFKIGDISGSYFEQNHGFSKSMGIRIGNFAYSTDVVSFPKESFERLKNLDLWIVGCLSYEKKSTHANVDQILKWAEQLKPRQIFLTHMGDSLDYDTLEKNLPENIRPAYDGLELTIDDE